jgi:DNA polymerase-4
VTAGRTIIHGDLDAFYASVEMLDDPSLRGRPVIVGGGPNDRGVVSAASYEARRFGVHSAMPLRTAARLCPDGVFLPGRFDRYRELSTQVMRLFAEFTPLVEPISLDEAFLDVSGSTRAFGDGAAIARRIKDRVLSEVGLVISVGVASNKLCAKVASDLRKPDALVVVPPGEEAAFLAPLPVTRLWGIGPRTAERLATRGVTTIGQVAALSPATTRRMFGHQGDELRRRAAGIDPAPVRALGAPKSVGHEVTFDHDVTAESQLEETLLDLADSVAGRLRAHALSANGVQLKLRYEGFDTITRQATLGRQTTDARELFAAALALLHRSRNRDRAIRLIGITAISLAPSQQLTLFDDRARDAELDRTVDAVRRKFGQNALIRGRLVGRPSRRRPSDRPVQDP